MTKHENASFTTMSPKEEIELYKWFCSVMKRLIADLDAAGYFFYAHPGPTPYKIEEQNSISHYLNILGVAIPRQVRNFLQEVGLVDLRGRWSAPRAVLNRCYSDPFVFCGASTLMAGLSEFSYDDPDERAWIYAKYGYLHIPFSPDYYSKAGESGGMPYCIELSGSPDPRVMFIRLNLCFTEYLETVCQFFGFPGFAIENEQLGELSRVLPTSTQDELFRLAQEFRSARKYLSEPE